MELFVILVPLVLLALACPIVMHFFMRGAHGGHSGQASGIEPENSEGRIEQLAGVLEDVRSAAVRVLALRSKYRLDEQCHQFEKALAISWP